MLLTRETKHVAVLRKVANALLTQIEGAILCLRKNGYEGLDLQAELLRELLREPFRFSFFAFVPFALGAGALATGLAGWAVCGLA